MILPYLRSSALAQLDFCEQSFFLQYALGLTSDTNKNAMKGTICHKLLEICALCKLARQNGEEEFVDEETGYRHKAFSFLPYFAFDHVFEHYTQEFYLNDKERKETLLWYDKALQFNNGEFNPLKREIIKPESHFDFVLDRPWAKFDGEPIRVKGTVDLITNEGCICLTDYKFGKRINWGTGEEKDHAKFYKDPQLRFYHLALSQIYGPQDFIFTVFWVRDGGPFTIPFEKSDIRETEKILKGYVDRINKMKRPKLNKFWGCNKFCFFGRNEKPGTGKTLCEFYREKVEDIGIDLTMEEFSDKASANFYHGGGKTLKTEDKKQS